MTKTAVAIVLVLGLGTGGALGLFSLLDAIALRRLPVERPDELVVATPVDTTDSGWTLAYPAAAYERLAEIPGLFTAVAGVGGQVYLGGQAGSDVRWWTTVDHVTGRYFEVLGIRPQAGRLLVADDIAHARPVAVASAQFWEKRLGADPHAVGSTIVLQGVRLTIVGITPPSYRGLEAGSPTDLTVPAGLYSALAHLTKPDYPLIRRIIGRRAPAVTVPEVEAALEAVWPTTIRATLPTWFQPDGVKVFHESRIDAASGATGFSTFTRPEYSRVLWLLVAAGILVVGLACLNVSTLLLAQSASREREFGIRAALGASPARLVRQLFGQTLGLAVAGTALGVPIAIGSARALAEVMFVAKFAAAEAFDFTPDRYVTAAVVATAVASALIIAVFPAVRATRSDLMRSAAGVAARTRRWGHRLLVVQIAGATVLVVAGWIVTANVAHLLARPGFATDGVTVVELDARPGGYPDHFDIPAYDRRVTEAVASIPGIRTVGLLDGALFAGLDNSERATVSTPGAGPRVATFFPVSPGTLGALEVPLLVGRDFTWADDDAHPRVAIVSPTLARALFGPASAVGQHLRVGDDSGRQADVEVVGVAAEARVVDLHVAAESVLYVPIAQEPSHPQPSPDVVIRADTPPAAWLAEVRSRLQSMGQDDVAQTMTLPEIMREGLIRERVVAIGGTYFACLAGLIMAVGLGGLMAYSVSCRTREMGIRSAIGASARAIRGLVIREAMTTVMAGLVTGLVAAAGLLGVAGRVVSIGSVAPLAFLAGAALTLLIGLAAAWVPARRATTIAPLEALRSQ